MFFGRGAKTRTLDTQFWRLVFYRLNYTPKYLAYILYHSFFEIAIVFWKNFLSKKTVVTLAITVGCLFIFTACSSTPNADPALAAESLKGNGYHVVENTTSRYDGLEKMIKATNDDGEYVNIYYFVDEAFAQATWKTLEAEYNVLKEASELLGEEIGYEIGTSGKMIYEGTSAGIKAAA